MTGTMMGIALRQDGSRYRGVIAWQQVTEEFELLGELEVLWEGEPKPSQRAARRDALRRYWGFYELMHGHKHPDDPSRRPGDPEPPGSVLTSYCDG